MSRTLTYSGNGTLNTWQEPANLANIIRNKFLQDGWGVSDVKVANHLSNTQTALSAITNPLVAAIPTWNYTISVTMTADDNDADAPNRGLNGTIAELQTWFNPVDIKLSHDSARPLGSFMDQYGLWIAGGVAALVVLYSLKPVAMAYAPPRYSRY